MDISGCLIWLVGSNAKIVSHEKEEHGTDRKMLTPNLFEFGPAKNVAILPAFEIEKD